MGFDTIEINLVVVSHQGSFGIRDNGLEVKDCRRGHGLRNYG